MIGVGAGGATDGAVAIGAMSAAASCRDPDKDDQRGPHFQLPFAYLRRNVDVSAAIEAREKSPV